MSFRKSPEYHGLFFIGFLVLAALYGAAVFAMPDLAARIISGATAIIWLFNAYLRFQMAEHDRTQGTK